MFYNIVTKSSLGEVYIVLMKYVSLCVTLKQVVWLLMYNNVEEWWQRIKGVIFWIIPRVLAGLTHRILLVGLSPEHFLILMIPS